MQAAGAQKKSTALFDNHYLHRTWHSEDGLPQNTVQAVLQHNGGYLWVGTQRGLARFDGVHFTVLNPANTPALKSANIMALAQTRDGSLWIGTENGGLVRMKDGTFTHFSKADGLAGDNVKCLFVDRDGILWVGTLTGLSSYADGKFRSFDKEWGSRMVRSIAQNPDGSLWLIGPADGVTRFQDGVRGRFHQENSLVPSNVRGAFVQRNGAVLLLTMDGLMRWEDESFAWYLTRTNGVADSVISSCFEDAVGDLWIGTYGGLNRLHEGRLFTVLNSDGKPYDSVFSMCEDREGNMWIGTKEGLSQLKPRVFEAFGTQEGLGHNNIMSILQDRRGRVWVNSWGGGLEQFENGTVVLDLSKDNTRVFGETNQMRSDLVLAAHETRDGSLWFGLDYNAGLYQYKDNELIRHDPAWKVIESAVRVIYEDTQGNLWVGTRAALFLLKDGVFTKFTTADGLGDNLVRAIHEDRSGNLWFGTSAGLTLRKDGKFVNYTKAQGLPSNVITALYEDKKDTLWIGTVGGGLVRYRDGKFTSYGTSQGLFNDDVFEILEDDFENLWMSCRFGVYRVSKKQLDALDRGEIRLLTSASFGKRAGLPSLECNAVAKPSAWKTRDGKLWFATTKGVAVVNPSATLKQHDAPPAVLIEKVIIDNEVFSPSTVSRLSPGRRHIEFHYTALSFSAAEKNRFRYKLEGFDSSWVDAGSRRMAHYSNLRPGDYTFKVMACDSDGVWNEAGSSLTFYLSPYFYETSWFLISSIATGAFLIFGTYNWRLRRWKKHQTELKALVEERTQHLKAEIAERQRIQAEKEDVYKQLVETSRKAGMAEVASGVLHNVGNVLNSVNVSANLLLNSLRNSRAGNIRKVACLLREESERLPEFFARDERAKQLPDYLMKLSEHIADEQATALRELGGLSKNVDHIKDIVSMQQTYAKFSGLVEELPVADLIEDALRMNAASLSRHSVEIVKDYSVNPVIATEKHKVIQILVNLISNAKHACDASERSDKRITIRIAWAVPGRIRISVRDNGIGIAADNLVRIFSHGFTTKKEGHGFGLHSSALDAKGLGGMLSVHSDGLGQGTVFELEFAVEGGTATKNAAL